MPSSTPEKQIADIEPPIDGRISVLTLTAATASAATDITIGSVNTTIGAYYTMICDADFYLTFGPSNSITTPVVATTGIASGAGAAMTMGPFAAKTMYRVRIVPGVNNWFKAISTPGGILRWQRSQGATDVS